jgi:predicted ABC-type transport system involved in lysophospholipase L1 biosynthesis ATPase subunit
LPRAAATRAGDQPPGDAFITHDTQIAARAPHVLRMQDGRLVEQQAVSAA